MKVYKHLISRRGISLLEVLLALVITGVITTALFKAYLVQHQNYMTQDDITTIQQSTRAAIDELSKHVRMAGNDVPAGMPAIEASNTNPDTITLTYRVDDCDVVLSDPMPQPSAELKTAGDISCFYEGQWVYIYDPADGAINGEWFVITEVQVAANHVQHNTMSLSKKYPADAVLLSLNRVKFFIDDTTNPDHPSLMILAPGMTSPQVYAENITDLDFTYRMKNGTVVDEPVIADNIREVIISITGRSDSPTNWDRDDGAQDEYRSRTYTSSVNVRNLGS